MTTSEIEALLDRARDACSYAQEVRQLHRRRSLPSRWTDLQDATTRINAVQVKLRSLIGLSNWQEVPLEANLRAASQELIRERRKLWKMANTKAGAMQRATRSAA